MGTPHGSSCEAVNVQPPNECTTKVVLAFRKSDNLRFEFPVGFTLGHELIKRFVNHVLHATSLSIRQFSKPPHHCLIDFV